MTADRYTDVGNAARLVTAHGSILRHVGPWATWLVWDGTRWRRDTAGQVVERAKQVAASLYDDALRLTGDDRKAAIKWAMQSESANRIDAMVRLARSDPAVTVDPSDLDQSPWLLNVANGTIDLRTGRLRPHDPAELHTKLAPVDLDPAAAAPGWHKFLERVVPDPEVREFLARAAGYSLTGTTGEQVLFFLHGTGANGKSVMSDTLLRLLGDYGKTTDPDLILARRDTHPTGRADLQGARLVVTSEIDSGRRMAEATVKQLTGGDPIKARFMREDFFEFQPSHKLWIHANRRPEIRGTDYAIWRRMRLVPFGIVIPAEERDRRLAEHLAHDELPGILGWALTGCAAWRTSGLTDPQAVVAATAEYRASQDIIGNFLAEECVEIDTAYASAADLHAAYTSWCEHNGETPEKPKTFGQALSEKGFHRRKHGQERRWHWFGIGLLNPRTDPTLLSVSPAHARAREAE